MKAGRENGLDGGARRRFFALGAALLAGAVVWSCFELYGYLRLRRMIEVLEVPHFYEGIVFDGRAVTGLSKEQVLLEQQKIEEEMARGLALSFRADEKNYALAAEDFGYRSDYEAALERAYRYGREGTIEERYRLVQGLKRESASFSVARGYDESILRARVGEIAEAFGSPAQDAQVTGFRLKDRGFSISEERPGARADAEALYANARALLDAGRGGTVEVARAPVQPNVTAASLRAQFGRISRAATDASGSSANRLNNIRLSLKALNGRCVEVGERFSFNAATGRRSEAQGYKSADVIVRGVIEQEPGGGVCQVSTTLFNAAAEAGLKIDQRYPHSRPSKYIGIGKDAMVNWPNADLQFTNSGDAPIYIVGELDGENRVVLSVYGKLLKGGARIRITSKETGTTPPDADREIPDDTLPLGERVLVEEARRGRRAVAYREYLDRNGKLIKSELLCQSAYPSAGNVYRVGTRAD